MVKDKQGINTYQNRSLNEWLTNAQQQGKIQDLRTVVLACGMDENEACTWVADIISGRAAEHDAIVFMQRAIQYNPLKH
jgi:hypothetical protein